ncbi:MAG TPA: metallophosphoesterase [Solirubrobacteraceae bacterium]|jgi:predicted phosphodiesterase|nr:metallophosphoesterase [Solirubrobacteraceae bacterium]
MRTLVLSDLHLGSVSRADLLRRSELREPLLRAVEGVDRVVLLGDVLELRHGPPRDALAVARPFFEDLGRALAGRELVLVAGNHDHALIDPWLTLRAELPRAAPLELEQLLEPEETSPIVRRLAEWAAPARTRFAYPGLWLRPDVYATHGHYLDCHLTVPTIERLSVGVMARMLGRPAQTFESVGDYEAVTAPMYAWRHAVARDARTGNALNGIATVNAWRALDAGGDGARAGSRARERSRRAALLVRLRAGAFARGFPLAVGALNRAGIGPLRAEVSLGELRGAGLRAIGEVAERLSLADSHVVFGHTHRTGPLRGDDVREWNRPPASPGGTPGARLVNCGCWTYDSIFLTDTPGESAYWPGTCVLVEDTGPPTVKRLLLDRTRAELSPRRRAAPASA